MTPANLTSTPPLPQDISLLNNNNIDLKLNKSTFLNINVFYFLIHFLVRLTFILTKNEQTKIIEHETKTKNIIITINNKKTGRINKSIKIYYKEILIKIITKIYKK